MKRAVTFKTLGCRLNQYETDALVSDFDNAGYEIVDFETDADVVVINTCTVTNQSDQKSRNIINQALRIHERAIVVVTGCMAEQYKATADWDKRIIRVENSQKSSILHIVEAYLRAGASTEATGVFGYSLVSRSLHTRGAVKIQDGCNNFCAFCIIPLVRGRAVSRPMPEIEKCVRETVANGFRELVITGVNISRYSWEGHTFEEVLRNILEIPGDFRIRISSMEPDGLSERFHELFQHPKLMPHLHLCLQSGSERILRQMHRMYTYREFTECMERFYRQDPLFNFTTDIIVGFPGETDEDFRQSLKAVTELGFSHVHTFKYSTRNNTRAARMSEQIHGSIKKERSEQIRQQAGINREKYLNRLIGLTQTVLSETIDEKGFVKGYGEYYTPIRFKDSSTECNTFKQVKITAMTGKKEKAELRGDAGKGYSYAD